MPSIELGASIPPDTAHAVSVSLPTWKSNVGYEEGEAWVVDKMTTGYPRFFIHKSIEAFASDIVSTHSRPGHHAMLFATPRVGDRCLAFVRGLLADDPQLAARVTVLNLALDPARPAPSPLLAQLAPTISAVIYPDAARPVAKQYWQHTGDGVSSRRAEFCHRLFTEGLLVPQASGNGGDAAATAAAKPFRGPKRYQRPGSVDGIAPKPTAAITATTAAEAAAKSVAPDEAQESNRFLEERYGRNLDLSLAQRASSAIRRRIAGAVAGDVDCAAGSSSSKTATTTTTTSDMHPNTRGLESLHEDDVYLYPAGMNAIYNAHRALLSALDDKPSSSSSPSSSPSSPSAGGGGPKPCINFGFPYVDTLKILQKFGPGGALFYGAGESSDLDDLEARLRSGQRFLGLFCEFPGNPLLKCPDLARIRRLADEHGFAVVVDETIGTFANINVLQAADVVVSSLTKIFSGDSNVMGGSAVLNPEGPYYAALKRAFDDDYDDTYWPEDVVFMERNSRDFAARVDRINTNAESICDILLPHPLVKTVYYPKHNPSRPHYDAYRSPNGGYGGLLSVVFHKTAHAQAFYDALSTAKGPSLGTNFTLCSPYVLLAHYNELDWAAEFGVSPDLVRISVGLEESPGQLSSTFRAALEAAEAVAAE
ncbi:hypothetical protein N3K66_001069 [Trichothecium roseum]|uniref:Uncharacterized protein n=1 Tax=Trichothecium roseum TaxID=47278 RepID=A0ACC0VDP2_9HYPO|nr:hypothetical protein N3K66_001069 [Trichothecium roseum]